jgi:hypothetical protein
LKAIELKKQNQGEESKFNYTYNAESKPSGKLEITTLEMVKNNFKFSL